MLKSGFILGGKSIRQRDVLGKPGRRMISTECEADLAQSLSRSVKQGQPWRLIGNAINIAKMPIPDLVARGVLAEPTIVTGADGKVDAAKTLESHPGADLAWKGKWGLPFYTDTWDGYPWAREELYKLSRKAGAGDLIFLTGDSHSFWANSLTDQDGEIVAQRDVGLKQSLDGPFSRLQHSASVIPDFHTL